MKCVFLFALFLAAKDSESEDDEPQFYLSSESSGRTQQSAPAPSHNLSLLSLTVIISKGRLQARTDRKVSWVAANHRIRETLNLIRSILLY